MRKLRFEISPQFLVSANQPYLIGFGGGANIQMHITDWFGIGGSFHYTTNVAAPLVGRMLEALPDKYAAATDPAAGLHQPSKQMFQDKLVGPSMLASLYVTLTPIGGKFSLFNTLFANYDFYGLAGAGVVILDTPLNSGLTAYQDNAGMMRQVVNCNSGMPPASCSAGSDVNLQSPDPFRGPRFAGVLGIGAHIFFNQWIGLQLELRDYIYKSNPGGGDVSTVDNNSDNSPKLTSADEYIVSNLYFGVGITIMLPPKAKISR
jgi:outer membrane beta-barrel protein